ncbi:MAG: AAA family ATPase [Candidatus Limnocylindrales bacterium]
MSGSAVAVAVVVVVALPRSEFRAVKQELGKAGYLAIAVGSAAELEHVLAGRGDVKVAILDGETDLDRALEMHAVLHAGDRNVTALVLVSTASFGEGGLGERGDAADEYFTRPYSAESLRWRVEAMIIRARIGPADWSKEVPLDAAGAPVVGAPVVPANEPPEARPGLGKVLVVFTPKGGVGKTTISINLGAVLQIRKRQRVLLVDCDTITGHIPSSLGLERPLPLVDVVGAHTGPGDGETLAHIATAHGSGIGVLVLAAVPLSVEILEPMRVIEAIDQVLELYDWIILDLHPSYGPMNLALFQRADQILVPVTPDIPSIRAAVRFREMAAELGFRDRLALVLNRVNRGVAVSDVEKTVALPSLGRIRSARTLFTRAAEEGKSAVERFPTAEAVDDLEVLADRLMNGAGPHVGTRPARGWRSRLARSIRRLFRRRPSQAS